MPDQLICLREPCGEVYCMWVSDDWWDDMPRTKKDRAFWTWFAGDTTRGQLARLILKKEVATA